MKHNQTLIKTLKELMQLLLIFMFATNILHAQDVHSDNGNGTYTDPLISADFPDPDVIRVGDTYYMVTTTMFVFPGVTILKSHDLVNWEYCSNAVARFDYSNCYNLDTRRPGDAEKNYANVSKANAHLNRKTKFGLEEMVRDAWNWQKALG